jgi:N-acyl-D-aspartate/D-glutamate deacylase
VSSGYNVKSALGFGLWTLAEAYSPEPRAQTCVVLLAFAVCTLASCARAPESFDLVVKSGRVIDPETSLDAVRDVGIRGDTIARVSAEPLNGSRTIDASGLVVAPGFIDLHEHGQNEEAYRLMALDGVTAGLELEVGVPDVRRFIDTRTGRVPIHFGTTASYLAARLLAWDTPIPASIFGPEGGIIPQSSTATNQAATPDQLKRIIATLQGQIEAGALGVGMGLEYAPGATRHEVIEVFRLAASLGTPVFVHVRSAGLREPGSGIESVNEIIGAAAVSGGSAHIVHINSSCMRDALECISMIAGARARGLDITTESYPYTAGMTFINAALFDSGWREKRGLDYKDLELPDTGERLTRERFDVLHASPEPRLILIHTNPDEVVDGVMAAPLPMIASDGLKDHPRGAGTHARVLARYVRDQKTITLNDAIRKMALMPAQRLEKSTPLARRLGRLQQGAQADIVVFDPQTIQDRATFRAPTEPSSGVKFLIVVGTVVVDDGRFVEGAKPGRPIVREATAKKGR